MRQYNFTWFLFLLVIFSCSNSSREQGSDENGCFLYKERYRALYLRNCDMSKMPDSIASKDIRGLGINSSEPIDFEALSKRIDLKMITSIRVDDLNQSEVVLDLSKFENLKSLVVTGGDSLKKINLINVNDSLSNLQLQGLNLAFPQFDSAFLNLYNLLYSSGKSEVIPQWVENLNNLQSLTFRAKHISAIECDVCKMAKIYDLDIIDREIENKELYLSKMSIYPAIKKIKACKPELRFWNVLPPY